MTDDTRERLILLEADFKHVTKQLDDMQKKVDAMYELLMQARGMKWLIVTMAALAGFATSVAAKYIPFFKG